MTEAIRKDILWQMPGVDQYRVYLPREWPSPLAQRLRELAVIPPAIATDHHLDNREITIDTETITMLMMQLDICIKPDWSLTVLTDPKSYLAHL